MIGSRRASTQQNESKTSLKTPFFPKLGANTAMFGLRNMYKPHLTVATHNSRIVKSLFLVHFVTSLELLSQPTIFILICLFYLFLFYSNIFILLIGSKNQFWNYKSWVFTILLPIGSFFGKKIRLFLQNLV